MIIVIGFLNYPIKKGHVRVNHIPWYDVVLMVAGAGPFLYFAANAQKILLTSYSVISKDPFMLALAIMAILVLDVYKRQVRSWERHLRNTLTGCRSRLWRTG